MADDLIAKGRAIAESGLYGPPRTGNDGDAGPAEPTETLGAVRPIYPPPSSPLDVARKLYSHSQYRISGTGMRTLLAWRGGWMHWDTTHWSDLDVARLRSEVYDALGEVDYKHPIRKNGITADYEIRPWSPDKHKVANVMEAMAAIGHLSTDIDPPEWIDLHSAAQSTAAQMISCSNGLLDLATRTIHKHTPALFNVVSVPFDFHPDAQAPTWLEFLQSVWRDDPDSVELLQEYVGYVLSGRTDMQKLLMLIGPTRSGKGTIARILTELVGRGHVAGPTLASLGTNFGLSPLLGKPLAIISDARLGDTPAHTVVERLLSITGEDLMTVDRKFREPWSGKLAARFVILSNELPRFRDASAAIANRMLILQMTESFLGREDRTLDSRLSAELPGILTWALQGLDRLNENGRFTVPNSSEDATNLMMDLASPVSAFVRDVCILDPDAIVTRDDLYLGWKDWAEENGHQAGAKSTFGRNLRAVAPQIRASRPRVRGQQVHCYTGISLQRGGLNAVRPDSPDSEGESAGHGGADESAAESGHLNSSGGEDSQVSACESGESGASEFKAHRDTPVCAYCGQAMVLSASVNRGFCERCRLDGKHAEGV